MNWAGWHLTWFGVFAAVGTTGWAAFEKWRRAHKEARERAEREETIRLLSGEPPRVVLGAPGQPTSEARTLPVQRTVEHIRWHLGRKELLLTPLLAAIGGAFITRSDWWGLTWILGIACALVYLVVLRLDREVRDV